MKISRFLRVLLVIIVGFCTIGLAAHATQFKNNPESFSYSGYQKHIRLHIGAISSLPGDIVLIGGYYHDGANTVHPALFISRDAGHRWKTVQFRLKGAAIERFQSSGQSHIWALVIFNQEGVATPISILRSIDAAKSWSILPVDFIHMNDPLIWTSDFIFFDTTHGLISMKGSLGGRSTYITKSSGDHWEALGRNSGISNVEIETDYQYPGFSNPPLNAPLWKKYQDFYKIRGGDQLKSTTFES